MFYYYRSLYLMLKKCIQLILIFVSLMLFSVILYSQEYDELEKSDAMMINEITKKHTLEREKYIEEMKRQIEEKYNHYIVKQDITIQTVSANEQDSLALVVLYNSTDGPNWKNNTNWLTDQPISTWHGVTVFNGRVVLLGLYLNNLNGSIPPELGNLSSLELLWLSDNKLSGSIPAELGNVSSLEILWLSDNNLSGSIPPELGNLSSLETLWLDFNNLSGSIPPELGNMSSLVALWLNFNELSGYIPLELGNLLSLEWLSLDSNNLSGNIPPETGNLSNLVFWYLQYNNLSGPLPLELINLSMLSIFYFYDTNLCIPDDEDFLEWLAGIADVQGTGVMCDNGFPKFLSLPFNDPNIIIQQGWVYHWPDPPPHQGIDYIKGEFNISATWQPFDVLAAADGWAMWSEQEGNTGTYGKFVFIQHQEIDDQGRRYFTLYSHLESVSTGIPYQDRHAIDYDINDTSKWKYVKRGEIIGIAGNTGAKNTGIHLHLEVRRGGYAQSNVDKIDPYDIYNTREYYPGGDKYTGCGENSLWLEGICPSHDNDGRVILTGPLNIAPSFTVYAIGDRVTAQYIITNTGAAPIDLKVLTVSGHGPYGEVVDFDWKENITLGEGESYNYIGDLILPNATGSYHFFPAYQNMDGNWITSIDLRPGLNDNDRMKEIKIVKTIIRALREHAFEAVNVSFSKSKEWSGIVKEILNKEKVKLYPKTVQYYLLNDAIVLAHRMETSTKPPRDLIRETELTGAVNWWSTFWGFVMGLWTGVPGVKESLMEWGFSIAEVMYLKDVSFVNMKESPIGQLTIQRAYDKEGIVVTFHTSLGGFVMIVPTNQESYLTIYKEYPDISAQIESPVQLRVYDSENRISGLVYDEIKEEIPTSLYNEDDKNITILFSYNSLRYKLVGTDTGTYGLNISSIENEETITFNASDIPTKSKAIHQYTIDWDKLSKGEPGVTIEIDSTGDGIFEEIINTTQPYKPSNLWPYDKAKNIALEPELKWHGGDPDTTKELTYSIYLGTNDELHLIDTIGPLSAAQETITYKLEQLEQYTVYHWKIVVRDNYRITVQSPIWTFTTGNVVSVEEDKPLTPVSYNLYQNYPNPFNPSTIIKYDLPNDSYVSLSVYNNLGQRVSTLVDENQSAGKYNITFDSKDLPSGVYFYRIKAGEFVDTKKMLLLR